MNNNRLFLLDAFALIYRAYFAFSKNPLINSKGMNTSAIQGFTNTLLDIINKENPTHIAICFDRPEKTERHTDFAAYKANRQEQPEDITNSLPWIRSIIEGFNIPILEMPGYEADDVVGTMAKKAEQHGYKVYMVTPDKDYGQLVSPNIFIYKPPSFGNSYSILGEEEIKQKWEIDDVNKVIDILGLMGDAVDNIPGLPGVGEKTAKKLIAEFGSVENLLANSDKLKGKLQETVINFKDQAILSKKLATIILDVPVEWNEEALTRSAPNKEKLGEIFRELEFRTLGKRILGDDFVVTVGSQKQTNLFGEVVQTKKEVDETVSAEVIEKPEAAKNISNTDHHYELVNDDEAMKKLIVMLAAQTEFCFDTESTGVDANLAQIVGLSFSTKSGEGFYVPLPDDETETNRRLQLFKSVLENESITKIGQNIKYDLLLLKWYGIAVKGFLWDTMLAHYILEPDMRHGMDFLSETYLGYKPVSITELIGKKGKAQGTMRDVELEKIKDYAAEDADITLQLKENFAPLLIERSSEKLFLEVECPLVPVLANMEYEGVKIDEAFLKDYSVQLEKEIVQREKEVYELAGVKFNMASPKQLGEVLFVKLQIPYSGKKTKTGQFSTDEDMLSRLAHEFPIADKLLDYRELTKLKSTYVDAIPALINPKTLRVHTSFNQAIAATGRLSSTNPNFQNIPIRTERGRYIRRAFIPRDADHVILSADYSQIELRIIAALSGDQNMLDAFAKGLDIHAATAAKVYGIDVATVDSNQRRNAKAVNFGIAYGQTAFGLSQTLGISRSEAAEIIDNYKKQFPGVTTLMAENIDYARTHGYVETVLGRRRIIRDINSGNQTVRNQAERLAINTPIQGSAADMIKVAMIKIQKRIEDEKLKSRMTLQVHDELVFDVMKDELEVMKNLVEHEMKTAIELKVPIEVGMGAGNNWLDAH